MDKEKRNKDKNNLQPEEFSNEFLEGLERNIRQNEVKMRKMKNWNKKSK